MYPFNLVRVSEQHLVGVVEVHSAHSVAGPAASSHEALLNSS